MQNLEQNITRLKLCVVNDIFRQYLIKKTVSCIITRTLVMHTSHIHILSLFQLYFMDKKIGRLNVEKFATPWAKAEFLQASARRATLEKQAFSAKIAHAKLV